MSVQNPKSETENHKPRKDLFDSTMSLGDHLEELRARLLYAIAGLAIGTIISFFFGTRIIEFIQKPYNKLMPDHPLTVLAPADAFICYMKISLIAGLIISSFWIFYHLWMFVAAGLYPNEKRYVHLSIPFSAALFVTGALFFYFLVAPLSLSFFLKFGEFINVTPNWTLQKYVSFMSILMLVFGIAFQTPIAIFILAKTGIVTIQALRNARKFVLLGVFIIAAMATPPDVISQITLAIPLYLLYELGILLSHINLRKKQ